MLLTDEERRTQLIQLWLSTYSPEKRTIDNTISFYGWVRDNRPELLRHNGHDPFWRLRSELRAHTKTDGRTPSI
jgi:hypothetical protein